MRSATARPPPPPFQRTTATWACYLLLGYFSLMVSSMSVLLPFLRLDLDLTFTQVSQLPSLYAIGLLVSSLTTDWLGRRFGARRLLWGGALGMAAGAAIVMTASTFVWSLSGFFMMGWLGALTLIQVSAVLSALHGSSRTRAISEANVLASFCAILAPLCLGGAVALGLGWRTGLGLVSAFLGVILLSFWKTSFPRPDPTVEPTASPLPRRFWRFWVALLLCVAVEFGILFWAVEYLGSTGLVTRAQAPLGLSAFSLMVLLGRILGARLAGRVAAAPLLLTSLGLTLVGFMAYWLGSTAWLQLAGLSLTGFGVANLYPFLVALALGSVAGPLGRASARLSLATGLAILFAPFVLGVLADLSSLRTAQAFLPLCLVLTAVSVGWAVRAQPAGHVERTSLASPD